MRTVIFDLDGTLADTSRDLIEAANVCFREMGFGNLLDPVADASTAFRGGRAMLALGMARMEVSDSEATVEAQYPRLLEAYGTHIDRHTKLYDGAMEAVEALTRDGFFVGICTNKPEALADRLLHRLGVRNAFASLIGADTLPVRKPAPEPYYAAVERAGGAISTSLLVGDTVTDRETARAAGVPSVLVTFGPDGAAVESLLPEATIGHFDELHGVVVSLIG